MHVWDPSEHYYPWLCDPKPIPFRYGDYSALRRPYLVDHYRADIGNWYVAGAVYVEAEWDPRDPIGEMLFIEKIRNRYAFPTVAVAQAWLDREDCPAVLEAHAQRHFVRAVRHKPQPGMMDDRTWRAGFRRLSALGLHFELQAPWRQLDEAVRLARDFPEILIVLNHAGLPLDSEISGWAAALTRLAACKNAAVKISGLGRVTKKREVILTAIEAFGTQRAMFASNFPVDGLCHSFDAIYSTFDTVTQHFSRIERDALFYENAERIYRMESSV